MNVQTLRKLTETHTLEQLTEAEKALLSDLPIPFEVDGQDESQQLNHLLAAVWIKENMLYRGYNFQEALNLYSKQVRETMN
jgi:hypothetical protein